MRHNVEKAASYAAHDYRAWDGHGNVFRVYKPRQSNQVWCACQVNGKGFETDDTLTKLADKLARQCFL